jgi:hypothetical protein
VSKERWRASPEAREASDYFNSLPQEERAKLAPLLEHYRQRGLAAAADEMDRARREIDKRLVVAKGLVP